ncbi:hypothetical protein SAMN04488118_107169 [Epibacterium ulvae]|uniref:Uncharacterized protein n=1 Tax=Epibacterium ulvae TaxID=1156985 RepID=A0A1G5R1U6_9RHOB|nr:hypothetical protein [Epibacterium ulvae]SCZ68043.1 hypothetical protein SAMN04488118_107169 [Epibacterium ulvae]
MQRFGCAVLPKLVTGFASVAISGCTAIEFQDGSDSGVVRVGAFSSIETAQKKVRVACGVDKDSSFAPIETNRFLPVITHSVHFFSCTEPAKDIQ